MKKNLDHFFNSLRDNMLGPKLEKLTRLNTSLHSLRARNLFSRVIGLKYKTRMVKTHVNQLVSKK